jgi:hypothetical protein
LSPEYGRHPFFLVVVLVIAYYKKYKLPQPEMPSDLRALTSGLEKSPEHNGHLAVELLGKK